MDEVTFRRWDASEHLGTEDEINDYFKAVCEENDLSAIVLAIGDIARARSMNQLARDAGISREGLHEILALTCRPSLEMVAKVAGALGLHFSPLKEEIVGKHARVAKEIGPRKEPFDRVEKVRDTVRQTKTNQDQAASSPAMPPPAGGVMGAKR